MTKKSDTKSGKDEAIVTKSEHFTFDHPVAPEIAASLDMLFNSGAHFIEVRPTSNGRYETRSYDGVKKK